VPEVGQSSRGRRWSERLERGDGCPGHALGSQRNGGDGGELNSAEEKACVVNFARMLVGVFLLWDGKNATPAALVLKRTRRRGLGRPRRAVTRPASSCVAAGRVRGSARSAAALGRGAPGAHRITVARHIPSLSVFCKLLPKVELKSNLCQNKSCSEF